MSKPMGWLSMGLVLLAVSFGLWGCEDSTEDSDSASSSVSTLVISPTAASFSAAVVTSVTFTASGGTGSYSWSQHDNALGSIVDSAAIAIYTSKTNQGTNFVIVTDTASNSVSATVIQL